MGIGIGRIRAAAWLAAPLLCSVSTAALAQALNYTTFGNPGSVVTTVTGIRGNGMTGDFTIGTGGATAGVLYTLPSLTPAPYPNASAPVNFTGATTNTPYGLSFGSASGIMRGTGSYKTAANGSGDLGYLFDGANAPGQQLTTLRGAANAFNTIGHSTFGNQLVGNWDTGNAAVGNAFLYNIAAGTMTTINRPGPYTSTTAYGVYGNRIAGGSSLGPGLSRAYILNQDTGVYTDYDAPGAGTVVTHFEGITGGGRANTYNLVADSVDGNGVVSSWVLHIDENGAQTWIPLAVPGASVTSANSIYGSTAIGVYVQNGVTSAFITTVPGIYNPITNNGALSTGTAGTTALQGIQGDDIVNNGTVTTTGAGSVAININTYGVVTNSGTVAVSGAGSTGVLMSGSFSSLLNYGTINAQPGTFAIQTDSTASGSLVFNTGVINGAVSIAAGSSARFENSGWMGISAAGAGVTHQISGTFAQTSMGTLSLRVAPNGVADQLVVNGVARLAGTMQTVFQPGSGFSKSYNLVTATGGLTGTFSTLSTQNLPAFLNASLAYGSTNVTLNLQSSLGTAAGAGHQSDRRRPGARRRLQQRLRPQCDAGPVQPDSEQYRLCADGAVGQQCQRRPVQRRDRRRPVRDAAGQPRGDAAGAAAAGDGGACRMHRGRRLPGRRRGRQLERLGQRLRRRAVAQYRPRHGRAGGAAVDRRRRLRRRLPGRAADGAGRGAGLERQQLFGGGDRRQRPRHRLPCRPLRHARLERLLRQRRAGLQPLRRQRHAPDRGHRHDGDGQVVRRSPTSSPRASKSAGRSSSATSRARGLPSRRSRPSSRCSCGRRPSPNRA